MIGIRKSFDFTSLLNDKKGFSLRINEYYGQAGYYHARNSFLDKLQLTAMIMIPFTRWPDHLATISASGISGRLRKVMWLYRNIYFEVSLIGLSEDEQIKVMEWLQAQIQPASKR